MPAPTKAQLLTLTHTFRGLPLMQVEPKALGTLPLGYTFRGLPLIATAGVLAAAISKFMGIAWASIAKINGIPVANIKKIDGVTL